MRYNLYNTLRVYRSLLRATDGNIGEALRLTRAFMLANASQFCE